MDSSDCKSSCQTSFRYHASALAFSGCITRPLEHLIEVQAGTALPPTGGYGHARVENFRFSEFASFRAGYSLVSGSQKIESGRIFHTTLATTVVEDLNVLNVVTADRVVARLSSSYEPGAAESRILLIGSYFENLRIAGCKIDVVVDHDWALKLDTFEAALKEYEDNADFRKIAADSSDSGKVRQQIDRHGLICCSIVKNIQPNTCPGITREGHNGQVLVIPEFGKIHLAEVIFEYGRKSLSMIRIELGCPSGGHFLVAHGGTNGRPPGGS
jgi:hypothetical protein